MSVYRGASQLNAYFVALLNTFLKMYIARWKKPLTIQPSIDICSYNCYGSHVFTFLKKCMLACPGIDRSSVSNLCIL